MRGPLDETANGEHSFILTIGHGIGCQRNQHLIYRDLRQKIVIEIKGVLSPSNITQIDGTIVEEENVKDLIEKENRDRAYQTS
jgi:hypothetical protein